jgi:competence protein ComEA
MHQHPSLWLRGRAAARSLAPLLATVALGLAAAPVAVADPAPDGPVVNVNTATLEELQALPGIGEARAHAIVEARQERGGFKSVDELLEIRGIGPANLERLRPHVRVSGQTRLAAPSR